MIGRFIRSDEALALAMAAASGAVVARFPRVTNILKQSHILLQSNSIIHPTQSMMHMNSGVNTSVLYAVVTTSVLVGGVTYAWLKFLRKDKEE